MQAINLEKLVKLFMIIAIMIICLYVFRLTFFFIYPFLIAFLLTALLQPLVTFMEKHSRLGRGFITFIMLSVLFLLLALVSFVFTKKLVVGLLSITSNLTDNISDIKQMVLDKGQAFYDQILFYIPFLKNWPLTTQLDHFMDKSSSVLIDFLTDLLGSSAETVASLSNFFIVFIFILLAVYMLIKDYPLMKSIIIKMTPDRFMQHFRPVITYTKQSFVGLIRAQLIITTVSAVIICICFYFFQLEHFFTLAVVIFFVDFIPYVGIGIIFIPWILFEFITGHYVSTIQLAALYGSILVFRQLIEPKIVAKEIGIHPFIALSILFIGYQTMGLLGILLTPFMLILISALYKADLFKAVYDYIYKK